MFDWVNNDLSAILGFNVANFRVGIIKFKIHRAC